MRLWPLMRSFTQQRIPFVLALQSAVHFLSHSPLVKCGSYDTSTAVVSREDCDYAVSLGPSKTNEICSADCLATLKSKDWPSYFQFCGFERWHCDGQCHPEGECYDRWVYGYADDPHPVEEEGIEKHMNVQNPADCQTICQKNPLCFSFMWRGLTGGMALKNTCVLKSEEQVQKAVCLELTGSLSPDPSITKWCNYGLDYQCNSGAYECLKCEDDKYYRCAYESHLHINGYRYCEPGSSICPTRTTTLQPLSSLSKLLQKETTYSESTPQTTFDVVSQPTNDTSLVVIGVVLGSISAIVVAAVVVILYVRSLYVLMSSQALGVDLQPLEVVWAQENGNLQISPQANEELPINLVV